MNYLLSILLIYLCYVPQVEKAVLVTLFIWELKFKSESRITPRLVTSGLIHEVKLPRFLVSISLFDLGPIRRTSVLSFLNLRKIAFIHLFIASKQFVMDVIAVVSFGSVDMYSYVSSA